MLEEESNTSRSNNPDGKRVHGWQSAAATLKRIYVKKALVVREDEGISDKVHAEYVKYPGPCMYLCVNAQILCALSDKQLARRTRKRTS